MAEIQFPARRISPYQQRRVILADFQEFNSQHTHSRQRKIYGLLSERIYFPLEPPPDDERDVRPFDFGGVVANLLMAASSFLWLGGPIPRASSWATNSRKRPAFKAFVRVSMGFISTVPGPYST